MKLKLVALGQFALLLLGIGGAVLFVGEQYEDWRGNIEGQELLGAAGVGTADLKPLTKPAQSPEGIEAGGGEEKKTGSAKPIAQEQAKRESMPSEAPKQVTQEVKKDQAVPQKSSTATALPATTPTQDQAVFPPPTEGVGDSSTEPAEQAAPSQTYQKILISEVQTAGETAKDEFVELYNPNSSEVDLAGWALKRKTSGGTETNLVSSAGFVGTIAGHGYFLIAPPPNEDGTPNYTWQAPPDLWYSGKTYSIASDNTVLLYDPNGDSVDKVGFGAALDFEGAPAENPAARYSIGRKLAGSAYGDTDSNFPDFEAQIPTPKTVNQSLSQTQAGGGTSSQAPPPESAPEEQPSETTGQGCQEGQVDINTAPKEDLLKIIHIGDARADELIQLRPFSSLDDLARIKGIGEQRVADIKTQGLACVG